MTSILQASSSRMNITLTTKRNGFMKAANNFFDLASAYAEAGDLNAAGASILKENPIR